MVRPTPEDTHPDIGAFEFDQSHPSLPPVAQTFTVTTTSDVSADDGELTLREALALAGADSSTADRIELQGLTIVLGGSQLTANSDVTIDGGAGVTIDANQTSRVLLVQGLGTDLVLQHLTVTGGRIPDSSVRATAAAFWRSILARSLLTIRWSAATAPWIATASVAELMGTRSHCWIARLATTAQGHLAVASSPLVI